MKLSHSLFSVLLICFTTISYSIETESVKKDGIKALQMGAGHDSIRPGQTLEVGLFFQHLPKFHTYWKAPGIVGMPTSIKWTLPEGFTASELEWPVPEVSKMAAYTCYGYERDVCLISKIKAPKNIEAKTITIEAHVSYMCCADRCYPSSQDFTLTIPVAKDNKPTPVKKWQSLFSETRKYLPVATPKIWDVKTSFSEEQIIMELRSKTEFNTSDKTQFFCETNSVHSDRPQLIELSDDKKNITFTFIRSEFAPKGLKQFTGLLFSPQGWPGTDSKWIQINNPIDHTQRPE